VRRAEQFVVTEADVELRLDQLLAARIEGLSRRRARALIDIGGVFVDGARVKISSRKLRPGQRVEAHLGGALERASKEVGTAARARDAAALPAFTVRYEDDDIVVVDKPAGLLTAPTPESDRGNLVDLLQRRRGEGRVFVVHRIDLQTSGLLVFATSAEANRVLAERFREHALRREYLAVVAGAVPAELAVLTAPVGGKHAVTRLAVERRFAGATMVRCRLETGRTHQIRLHCRGAGHPVLGDPEYGERPAVTPPPRMALHAAVLGFDHPRTAARIELDSPWPAELAAWTDRLAAVEEET
jgi:23S rRNA pseudouridine1911/1915/1917 synthase